jgi:hypothetical protein
VSRLIDAQSVEYRGVLIERPCLHCDTTSFHLDGLCQDGPCTVCGVNKRVDGWASHPAAADGLWRSNYAEPMHDWAAHSYEPAQISATIPAFEAMIGVALQLGWPERYTSDLFRDYQFTKREDAPQRFCWVIRKWGTHIITAHPSFRGALGWMKDNEPEARVFCWTGTDLVHTTFEMAATCLSQTGWVRA